MVRLFLAGLISIAMLPGARAESLKDATPHIVVTGTASEEAAPDLATLVFAVVTERASAAEAQDETAKAAQAAVAELGASGVEAKDVRTESVSLISFTREERDPRGQVKRSVKLFRARAEIAATIRSPEKAGKILAALVDKGANEIVDVRFSVSDAEHRREALRKKAIQDAKARAAAYVEAIDLKLARVLEIQPGAEDGVAPHALRAAPAGVAASAGVADIPLNPGTQRLSESVTVVFAIAR
jgi:uncharacterized protein